MYQGRLGCKIPRGQSCGLHGSQSGAWPDRQQNITGCLTAGTSGIELLLSYVGRKNTKRCHAIGVLRGRLQDSYCQTVHNPTSSQYCSANLVACQSLENCLAQCLDESSCLFVAFNPTEPACSRYSGTYNSIISVGGNNSYSVFEKLCFRRHLDAGPHRPWAQGLWGLDATSRVSLPVGPAVP